MKEEAIVIFALLAIFAIPFVCLIAANWRAMLKGFAAMGVIGCIFAIKVYADGSTKPPTPPPQPPSEEVRVKVSELTTRGLTINPIVDGIMMDNLYGKRCEVQIKRDGSAAWETVAVIDAYDLRPRFIPGVFVSGGAKTVRRLRLYWPDVDQEMELEQ